LNRKHLFLQIVHPSELQKVFFYPVHPTS
jgi:hypothetical protein